MSTKHSIDISNAGLTPEYDHIAHWGGTNPNIGTVRASGWHFEKDGEPMSLVGGEFHPQRYPVEEWEEAILKMKAGGINMITSYIFWNMIEPRRGEFDFEGQNHFRTIGEICARNGLYWQPRVGPFCNSEMLVGGLPVWLYGLPLVERSDDPLYLDLVKKYYASVAKHLDGLFWEQGGPILMIQLENELTCAPNDWGTFFRFGATDGHRGPKDEAYTEHYRNLHRVAVEAGLRSPFYCMTGWGELTPPPENTYIPTYGGYMYLGEPGDTNSILTQFGTGRFEYKGKYPLGFCEIGPGSPARTDYRPTPPADSAYCSTITRLGGSETSYLGYYMYHGGTFPRHPDYGWLGKQMNMPLKSYDFYSPVSEFGRTRESYRRLRPMNQLVLDFAKELSLAQYVAETQPVVDPNEDRMRVCVRANEGRGFVFACNYGNVKPLSDRQDFRIELKNGDDSYTFPQEVSLNIPSGDFAILPFNIELTEGLSLAHASAQPFCRFESKGEQWWFFHALGGATEVEYAVSGEQLAQASISGAAQKSDSVWTNPVNRESVLKVTLGGAVINLVTLTREDAENAVHDQIDGQSHLMITADDLHVNEGRIRILHTSNNSTELLAFPALDQTSAPAKQDGIFTLYQLKQTAVAPELDWQLLTDTERRGILRIDSKAYEGVHELFASIDYAGDICRIFDAQTGELLADDLQLGEPWIISLRRFRKQLTGDGLQIRIEPRTIEVRGEDKQDTMVLDAQVTESDSNCRYRSISLTPQYCSAL